MAEVFIVMFVMLSIVGLVTVVKKLIMMILKCDEGNIVTVIPIEGHCENIEYRIRCAYERANWSAADSRLICLDKGMDKETCEICQKVCERFGIEIIQSRACKNQYSSLIQNE